MTGLPRLDLVSFDDAGLRARPDTLALRAQLAVANVARRAAGRILVPIAPLAPAPPSLPEMETERTQPVRLGHRYVQRGTVRLVAPEGYRLHVAPETVEIEGPAGRYRLDVTAEGDDLVVTRELEVTETDLPPEAYDEVRAFFAAVAEADAGRVVFKPAE